MSDLGARSRQNGRRSKKTAGSIAQAWWAPSLTAISCSGPESRQSGLAGRQKRAGTWAGPRFERLPAPAVRRPRCRGIQPARQRL